MTPAGAAWGSVLELSFLKDPHPSGHQLELGQVHHLEMEEENGSTRRTSPSSLRPRSLGPQLLPCPLGPGASTCVWVELELSLRAGCWVVVDLLLLFPLFHLQNSLQGVGEITEARGYDVESPWQPAKWSWTSPFSMGLNFSPSLRVGLNTS